MKHGFADRGQAFTEDKEKEMRKTIFDAIRAERGGKGFTAAEVEAIDALLDQLGLAEDAPASPPAPDPAPAFVGTAGLDNSQAFFDSVRQSGVIGNSLKPEQVSGLEAVLNAAKEAGWPLAFAAYALATAAHETNYTMQPVREAYWLSENWRRTHLRYYPFYGRGYVQLTWEANYKKADTELGLGGSLTSNLDRALEPEIAAKVMAKGMQEGWFAGDKNGPRHTLARHLGAGATGTEAQFESARRIINGTDKAEKIAGEALKFQTALQAGGW
jgi:putative chitinase